MTFDLNFKISSYVLIGSGFLALATTGLIGWTPVSMVAAAMIISWFADTERIRESVPVWIQNGAGVLFVLLFILDIQVLSRSVLIALARLLFFAVGTKLLVRARDRDYGFLYLASCTALLASSAIAVNLAFVVYFLIFLFSAVHTFILFEMRHSNSSAWGRPDGKPGHGFPNLMLLGISSATSLLILLLAVPLFLLLPRSAAIHQSPPSGDTQFISGFSEKVELGKGGSIRPSKAVVMRVRTSIPPSRLPEGVKWRGLAFDRYDGRGWSRSNRVQDPVPIREGHFKLEDSSIGTDWIHQTFFLEALSTNVLFAAHKPLAISREAGFLTRDSLDNLYAYRRKHEKLRYVALSDLSLPNPSFISDAVPIPPDIRATCLQLPTVDADIQRLADQATAYAVGAHAKAAALEHYLRSHYAYSMELADTPESEDPVSMFLFQTRRGHCEYFSSAMAIMLRYLGIPSRLVNGYRTGDYNRLGGNWIVRQYHAHSWTEAYLPHYGWKEFDPTPFEASSPSTAGARLWSDIADTFDLWWWERVVHYDAAGQNTLVISLRSIPARVRTFASSMAQRIRDRSRHSMREVLSPGPLRSLAGGWYWKGPAIVAILLLVRPVRRKIRSWSRPFLYRNRPRQFAGSFYAEALELLSKHGMVRPPGQTPLEFARSIGHHPAADPLYALTRLYNRIRFGPPDADPGGTEAAILLRALSRSMRG